MQVNEVLQEAEENIVKLKYVKLAKRAMSELDPPKNQKKIQIYKKIEEIANNKEDIKNNKNQVMSAIKVALNLRK
jgi:hypothetical protein